MKVPFLDLPAQYKTIKDQIDSEVMRVIASGSFIMGVDVEDLESQMDDYLGTKTITCANGSDALFMALKAIDLKPGDEVITTTFTFFATAGAIVRAGGTPVFVDIENDTFNINPKLVEDKITENTRAIIPVHIFGHSADMAPLLDIAQKHNIFVIEDACQSIGSEYKGRKTGSLGDIGCFSFFPTKNLGAYGDGGLLTARSEEHYQYLKKYRVHGATKKYYHDFVGINSRLDALQAAVLKVKLKHLDDWNRKRHEIADKYTDALKQYVGTPVEKEYATHVYHQYSITTPERDKLLAYLKESEIAAGVYYPVPLHLQNCFKDLGYKKGDLPVSEKVSGEILSLPIFPEIIDEQVRFVVDTIVGFY